MGENHQQLALEIIEDQDSGINIEKVKELEEPKVGMLFDSDIEARRFYANYAKGKGFGVCISNSKKRDGIKYWIQFSCHKGGLHHKIVDYVAIPTTTKTDCKAAMDISKQIDNKWKVNSIHLEHNHAMDPDRAKYSRCYPEVASNVPSEVEILSTAGIEVNQSVDSFEQKKLSLIEKAPKKNADAEKKTQLMNESNTQVFVPPHPLIKHWISVLRDKHTHPPIFKSAMAELGRLLMYEASRDWLLTVTGEVQSPVGVASVEFVDPKAPVAIVPILRAGLALAEHATSVLPATTTYHLGFSRDEQTLQPYLYLNKLPGLFSEGTRVFVVDPMLATGGTIVAAIDLIKKRGIENSQIKVIAAVAAPPALQKLSEKFPGLHVYCGIIDSVVNEKGFIIPGLGDAGDRSFGT